MVLELLTRAKAAFVEGEFVCIRLEDSREIRFPISANRRLREATSSQREKIEIISNGTGLHWPELDEDLSVLGILEGASDELELFGKRRHTHVMGAESDKEPALFAGGSAVAKRALPTEIEHDEGQTGMHRNPYHLGCGASMVGEFAVRGRLARFIVVV